MATPTCELCGSSDFVKSEGMFVCQGCGTKYSPEEAQKLMKEEPKGVIGVVAAQAREAAQAQQLKQALHADQHGEPHGEPHGGPHGETHGGPHGEWQGQELRSAADFNAQAININSAGPRGVNNYVCQAWQLIIEEYNSNEHPDKQQHDLLTGRAKECLMLLNSAALIEPANNVQNLIIFDNCLEIEESVRKAHFWEQAEDGSWKSKTIGAFDKIEIAGQDESWEDKRDRYRDAIAQIYIAAHPDDAARKKELQEQAENIQAQLGELKDEKRSKGFFNFKEKGEVKERMKPVKEELAAVNREINEIDRAAENFVDQQLKDAGSAYVCLDF